MQCNTTETEKKKQNFQNIAAHFMVCVNVRVQMYMFFFISFICLSQPISNANKIDGVNEINMKTKQKKNQEIFPSDDSFEECFL